MKIPIKLLVTAVVSCVSLSEIVGHACSTTDSDGSCGSHTSPSECATDTYTPDHATKCVDVKENGCGQDSCQVDAVTVWCKTVTYEILHDDEDDPTKVTGCGDKTGEATVPTAGKCNVATLSGNPCGKCN